MNNIGWCYFELGDYTKALEYYTSALDYYGQCLAIKEKVLGKEHPDYAEIQDKIASCRSAISDYAKAPDTAKRR